MAKIYSELDPLVLGGTAEVPTGLLLAGLRSAKGRMNLAPVLTAAVSKFGLTPFQDWSVGGRWRVKSSSAVADAAPAGFNPVTSIPAVSATSMDAAVARALLLGDADSADLDFTATFDPARPGATQRRDPAESAYAQFGYEPPSVRAQQLGNVQQPSGYGQPSAYGQEPSGMPPSAYPHPPTDPRPPNPTPPPPTHPRHPHTRPATPELSLPPLTVEAWKAQQAPQVHAQQHHTPTTRRQSTAGRPSPTNAPAAPPSNATAPESSTRPPYAASRAKPRWSPQEPAARPGTPAPAPA